MTEASGPLVTVIVAALDVERHISRAVTSLLGQTHTAIEIVVVDHGSRDGSLAVAQDLADQDERVRVVSTVDRMGVEYARGLGLLKARGDFVTFQDAEGWSAPSRIERQIHVLNRSEEVLAAVCGGSRRWALRHSRPGLMMNAAELRGMFPVRHGLPQMDEIVKMLSYQYGRQAIAYVSGGLYRSGRKRRTPGASLVSGRWVGGPVIAGMATIKKREEFLPNVVASLADQVDELHIHLNDYEELPSWVEVFNNVRVTNFRDFGDMVDNGKFLPVTSLSEPYYLLTVDDDIVYPPDYVDRMTMSLDQLGRKAAVGVHGAVLATPFERYYAQREVVHFSKGLERKRFVDIVGTGTMAIHTSMLKLSLDDFETTGMADLWFAITCRRHNIPRVVIERPMDWLAQLGKGWGLYTAARQDDEVQTSTVNNSGTWGSGAVSREVDQWLTEIGLGDNAQRTRFLSGLGFGTDIVLGEAVHQ